MSDIILSVQDLSVQYEVENDVIHAVNHVSFDLHTGEMLGLVGETGAGKTTIALTIMGLLPVPPAVISSGRVMLDGMDICRQNERQMRKMRGKDMAMIFQDPMTALNPTDLVGDQIREVILLHESISKKEATRKAEKMMETVGIPRERYYEYPHQFSGGMRQRVVIAMALACNPKLLIADEPTTALDVTIQAQILRLIKQLQRERNTSNVLITHDLGVVAETCDRVAVIYGGEILEYGTVRDVFKNSAHPYTEGLFQALPSIDSKLKRLRPIPGSTPDPANLPKGCKFAPRCPYCRPECQQGEIPIQSFDNDHWARCVNHGLPKGGA